MYFLPKLAEVYDRNKSEIGSYHKLSEDSKAEYTLAPIYHSTRNTHIEITLDTEGNILRATPGLKVIVIPITEDSNGRSSDASPHGLHDELKYVAGDFNKYTKKGKKQAKEDDEDAFTKYLNQLSGWASLENTPIQIKSIYKYIKKGTLIQDLVEREVLYLDKETNLLLSKWKGKDKPILFQAIGNNSVQEKAFIRFNVFDVTSFENEDVWQSKELFESYTNYYRSTLTDVGFCSITGETTLLTRKHPRGIRKPGDGPKLISSNKDAYNDGLFTKVIDKKYPNAVPLGVGFDISQKAHNALKWLITKQGVSIGDKVYLVWGTKNLDVPNVAKDTTSIFSKRKKEDTKGTEEFVANRFKKALQGYKTNFADISDNVHILVLDSFSEGRLQVLDYRELKNHEYLNRIEEWQRKCSWKLIYENKKGDTRYIYGAPSFLDMAYAIYGEVKKVKSSKDVKKFYDIALNSVLDNRKLPSSYIQQLFRRIIRKSDMKTVEEWDKTLEIGCAMLKWYYEKERYDMALNKANTDRNYLAGRLLAIADMVEKEGTKENENKKGKKKTRETNAMRYIAAFKQNPATVWGTIQMRIMPYFREETRAYFEDLIDEVMGSFKENEFNNSQLSAQFLLGFSNQRESINNDFLRKIKEG